MVIEKNIVGKRGYKLCEDAFTVTDAFIVVADGSTSKSTLPPTASGLTHGQIAARCVCEYAETCPPDIDMTSFCKGVTIAVRKQYAVHRPDLPWQHLTEHPEDRITCSAVIYSKHRREIWLIGDCHCLLVSKSDSETRYYDNPKPMEDILASRRAERIRQLLAEGAKIEDIRLNDEGRASIIPALKESMKAQNIDYAVIDGFDIPTDKVKCISVDDSDEIILATDGYPRLYPTLDESEHYLRSLLEHDPLLIKDYQATKAWHPDYDSFDDRCYIRFACE